MFLSIVYEVSVAVLTYVILTYLVVRLVILNSDWLCDCRQFVFFRGCVLLDSIKTDRDNFSAFDTLLAIQFRVGDTVQ